MNKRWKRSLTALFVLIVLCLMTSVAAAYETSEQAQAAYDKLDTAVAEEYGRDSATGLANFPDGFGGAWLDEQNYLVIGLTEEGQADQQYYIECSGDPDVLRFVQVKYSLKELLNIQSEISQTYPDLKDVDFYLEGALINLPGNTVELTVMQGGLESALSYYTAIYGDAISGVEGQEAIEDGTMGEETTQGLVLSIWIVIAVLAVIVAAIILVVILVVLLVQSTRKKKKLQKAEMEQAAARAAQMAKTGKKKK